MSVASSCSVCCPECNAPTGQSMFVNSSTSQGLFKPFTFLTGSLGLVPYGYVSASVYYYADDNLYIDDTQLDTSIYSACYNQCIELVLNVTEYTYESMFRHFSGSTATSSSVSGYWYESIYEFRGGDCGGVLSDTSSFLDSAQFGMSNLSKVNVSNFTSSLTNESYRETSSLSYTGGLQWTSCAGDTVSQSAIQERIFTQSLSVQFSASMLYPRVSQSLANASVSSSVVGSLLSSFIDSPASSSLSSLYTVGDVFSYSTNGSRAYNRFRFLPKSDTGSYYRVDFTVREANASGSGLSSVSVHSGGVFRPTVGFNYWYSDEDRPVLLPLLDLNGGVSHVKILYGGANVPIDEAISFYGGATDATADIFIVSGSIVSSSVTSGGNYKPTGSFNRPTGGVAATASFGMDQYGRISMVTLINTGSRYIDEPTITFTNYQSLPVLHSHFGTEVTQSLTWNNVFPTGYNRASISQSFWPTLPLNSVERTGEPWIDMGVPSGFGKKYITHVRYTC